MTRSGTNEFHGDVFAYGTNERLGANVPLVQSLRYENEQYGLSLGGPIVQDRLLFFLASEVQQRTIPARGPYVGQGPMGESMLPVSTADISRFSKLLSADGLDGGTAGAVTNANPSSAAFLRLDAPLSRWNSRITARASYSHGDSSIFARPTALAPTNCPTNACFPLSSLQHSRWVDKRSAGFQFVSNFASGAYNELLVGYTGVVSGFRPTAKEPLVLVTVPGNRAALPPSCSRARTRSRPGRETPVGRRSSPTICRSRRERTASRPVSRRRLFDLRAFQQRGAYGVWEFASLDSLQAGIASRYRVTRDTGSTTAANGGYGAAYVSDEWDASPRLSLTLGLRSDVPLVLGEPSIRERRRLGSSPAHRRAPVSPSPVVAAARLHVRPDDCRRAHAVTGRRRAVHGAPRSLLVVRRVFRVRARPADASMRISFIRRRPGTVIQS